MRLIGEGEPLALLHNNLAVVMAAQGRYTEAVAEFQVALSVDAKTQKTFENLNGVYELMASKAYREALGESAAPVVAPAELQLIAQWQTPAAVAVQVVADQSLPEVDEEQLKDELLASLHTWAEAWSSQDVEAYLDRYDRRFAPAGGLSYATWQQQRRVRVRAPKFIEVSTANIQLLYVRNNIGSVLFDQNYRSNRFEDTIRKNLVFVRGPQGWSILQEQIIR